ncbi:MAG TPA: 4-(cytidine 5'-diphospho)-2-C-methyl-D-erythritol kinase [Blastocatellia bacterium]|nr:4-(cytidine 5'-diphospho)-2-C-methyl-D-erythritol kinase [Blastocatellia bacterium]
MPASVIVKSYAKINWTLDVLHRRADGYHELRTILQTVSLHDRLRLTETAGEIEVTCDDARVPTDETNLAYKAAKLLREAAGQSGGARIDIQKRIPVAGGLGGGSSNAAATLMGLARMWRIEPAEPELFKIAARIGSDVPFFLVGGTALGVGRGEEVYPLEEVDCLGLLLVNPGVAVETADAYRRLSRLTTSEPPRIIPFALHAAKGIHELPLAASNDLESVVLAAHPEIAEVKRRLLEAGARHAVMSGSGGTVFGVFDSLEASERGRLLLGHHGCWAERVSTVSRQQYRSTMFD